MCKTWNLFRAEFKEMTNNSQNPFLKNAFRWIFGSCSEVTLCMYIDGNIGHCRWIFAANEYRCALSSSDFTVDRRRKWTSIAILVSCLQRERRKILLFHPRHRRGIGALSTNVRDKGGRGRDEKADSPRYEDGFWREISETCYQWRWLNSILRGVLTTFSFVGCVCARDRIGFTRRRSGGQLMRCRPTRSLFVRRDRNVISGSKATVIAPRSLLIG